MATQSEGVYVPEDALREMLSKSAVPSPSATPRIAEAVDSADDEEGTALCDFIEEVVSKHTNALEVKWLGAIEAARAEAQEQHRELLAALERISKDQAAHSIAISNLGELVNAYTEFSDEEFDSDSCLSENNGENDDASGRVVLEDPVAEDPAPAEEEEGPAESDERGSAQASPRVAPLADEDEGRGSSAGSHPATPASVGTPLQRTHSLSNEAVAEVLKKVSAAEASLSPRRLVDGVMFKSSSAVASPRDGAVAPSPGKEGAATPEKAATPKTPVTPAASVPGSAEGTPGDKSATPERAASVSGSGSESESSSAASSAFSTPDASPRTEEVQVEIGGTTYASVAEATTQLMKLKVAELKKLYEEMTGGKQGMPKTKIPLVNAIVGKGKL